MIYEQADGQWALHAPDGTIRTFTTEGEATMAQREAKYLASVQSNITALAQAADGAEQAVATYWARTYNGESLTDADLAAAGLTRAQLTAYLVLAEQLGKLLGGEATAPAAYRQTLDALRGDL